MRFKGAASPGSEPGTMKVTASATSCTIKTVVGPDGVTGQFAPAEGGMGYFESEVRTSSQDSFVEQGTITFGDGDHSLKFSTVGEGHLGPGAEEKTRAGVISWKVEGGQGQFEGASGLITSNFFIDESGGVVDFQFGVVYVA
jgi:hypothetical protein